ncbi:MAG: hypothetical protein V7L22_23470 [Nostoc sp.]|uniref:hypothetical protein n=1 Tax=Nostoc sp. TaxID=1180 RepID=UPI002FF892A9
MARYAVVNADKVINTITLEDISNYTTPFTLVASETANIGDSYDGASFTPPVVIPQPDWNSFGLGLFSNPAFNRIANSSGNKVAIATLISIGTTVINTGQITDTAIATIPVVWNGMVDGTPQDSKPTTEEIAGWNAIALASSVSFVFGSDGKIGA